MLPSRLVPLAAAALLAIGTAAHAGPIVVSGQTFELGRFIAGRTPVFLVSDAFEVSASLDRALRVTGPFTPSLPDGGGTINRTSRSRDNDRDTRSSSVQLSTPGPRQGSSGPQQGSSGPQQGSSSGPPASTTGSSPGPDLDQGILAAQILDPQVLGQENLALALEVGPRGVQSSFVPTPEPASLLLLGTGIVGVAARRFVKRRRA